MGAVDTGRGRGGPHAAPFHVMAKPAGAACNLDCEYCFFLSKGQLYPDGGPRMPAQVHEDFIRQLCDGHPDGAEVEVDRSALGGARFTLSFPLRAEEAESAGDARA